MTWEPVIGLEVHVHLKTRTKMFCRCAVGFGAEPNTQTCPVCLAFPGALPVVNRTAVEWTIKLGLALGCGIAEHSVFSRKNYFYFDSPKAYQISQYDLPFCINGNVLLPTADGDRVIGIIRAHLEEDAAKTVHVGGRTGRIRGADHSLVDFNRGGTPLVEIVTAPDIRSADEAKRFLQLLRQTIVELGISDAEMEKGTLRVDANVSVRPAGSEELRTRTELKNMNSFTFIARGIDAEIARQIAVWESGDEVRQETYDFEAATGALTPHRAKEEADDYRYFPEPDLVPIEPPPALVEQLRSELPELPSARIGRLESAARPRSRHGARDRRARPALAGDRVLRRREARGGQRDREQPGRRGRRSRRGAGEGARPARRGAGAHSSRGFRRGDLQADRAGLLGRSVSRARGCRRRSRARADHRARAGASPGQVEAFRSGKDGLLGFFVGQVMKETEGKANPRVVSELLRAKLKA